MFVAVPVVVSIVAILGAFEVLSAIYLPESRTLFALITGAGGLSAVFFTAFAIGDGWQLGPTYPDIRKEWLVEQWVAIRTHEAEYKWTKIVAVISSIPILFGMGLRAPSAVHDRPPTWTPEGIFPSQTCAASQTGGRAGSGSVSTADQIPSATIASVCRRRCARGEVDDQERRGRASRAGRRCQLDWAGP
jgi:hypothetical protein